MPGEFKPLITYQFKVDETEKDYELKKTIEKKSMLQQSQANLKAVWGSNK